MIENVSEFKNLKDDGRRIIHWKKKKKLKKKTYLGGKVTDSFNCLCPSED